MQTHLTVVGIEKEVFLLTKKLCVIVRRNQTVRVVVSSLKNPQLCSINVRER